MNLLDLSLAELYPEVTFNFQALNACNLISTSIQVCGEQGGVGEASGSGRNHQASSGLTKMSTCKTRKIFTSPEVSKCDFSTKQN